MKTAITTLPFRKTATCPASATLVSFRCQNLPAELATSVKDHLRDCDFCGAELRLLAHTPATIAGHKTPDIPMNLRILAESILAKY